MSTLGNLVRSRSAHIGVLTKCQNEIKTLMRKGEQKEKIIERFEKFEEHWRKFVNIHEEYFELLEDDD